VSNRLKHIRRTTIQGVAYSSVLKELNIDWYRFKKSLLEALKLLKKPQKRRKNFPWLAEPKKEKPQD
jgi:hypothetical protein